MKVKVKLESKTPTSKTGMVRVLHPDTPLSISDQLIVTDESTHEGTHNIHVYKRADGSYLTVHLAYGNEFRREASAEFPLIQSNAKQWTPKGAETTPGYVRLARGTPEWEESTLAIGAE